MLDLREFLLDEIQRYTPHLERSEIDRLTAEWRCVPYMYRGEAAGAAAMCGVEIHFFLRPEWHKRALQRRALREFLTPLLTECGMLVTRVPHGSHAGKFVRGIGFESCGGDKDCEYFMLTKVKF